MNFHKALPRITPDRDSRYMGQAWIIAAFSKDPNTQVGAVIVTDCNAPLGSGYNGPPSKIDDDSFSWERPPKDNPEALSKYDVIRHAEINAIDYSFMSPTNDFSDCTLYVTSLPCPKCMLEIVSNNFGKVVYFDYQGGSGSSLNNAKWREKSIEIAKMGGVKLEVFKGNINWILDWVDKLKQLQIFDINSDA